MKQPRKCSARDCNHDAEVYAMDTIADGWADYYCEQHIPRGWIVERLRKDKDDISIAT